MTIPSEVRCPTPSCNKLLIGLSPDFAGAVSIRCGRCKIDVGYPSLASVPDTQIRCGCHKWLATGQVTAGSVRLHCSRDRVLAIVRSAGVVLAEESRATIKVNRPEKIDTRPMIERDQTLVGMIEDRWTVHRAALVRRSIEIAVGLRFDVFNRDGFRCRYCGRGPEQGVFLEVDHVVPRSAGGPDTMANLVTACWDCNRGKSAKPLTAS